MPTRIGIGVDELIGPRLADPGRDFAGQLNFVARRFVPDESPFATRVVVDQLFHAPLHPFVKSMRTFVSVESP